MELMHQTNRLLNNQFFLFADVTTKTVEQFVTTTYIFLNILFTFTKGSGCSNGQG